MQVVTLLFLQAPPTRIAMGEWANKQVHCKEHGPLRPAFVCQHLVHALRSSDSGPIGFFQPDPEGPDDDDLQAWCGNCDQVLLRVGEWNDESEGTAGLTCICSGCFDRLGKSQRSSASD